MGGLMAQVPQIRVVQALDLPSQRRKLRRPRHTFNLKSKPYEIVPFMIAPVLPGETMQSLLMQSRVVSDPIKNKLIGWHKEYYFFYVKHRSLVTRYSGMAAALQSMMLDTTTSLSSYIIPSNDASYYSFKGAVNYVGACHYEVIKEYFRDEDEDVTVASIENYPAAQIDHEAWWQNLKTEASGTDDDELPGVDELEEEHILSSHTTEYAQWELMRDHGLTDLTYEDYLRSYGVTIPKSEDEGDSPDERHKPELIRFVREWTYPTNTIDPADGSAASAAYWSVAERADKKRFFKEPGFIYGVTVARPKLYMGNFKGAAAGYLDNAYAWLPAVLQGHEYISLKECPTSATDGILQNQTTDVWFDLRDLYLHGDQFVNHAMTAADNHGLGIPGDALANLKYPTDALVESLFVTAGSEYIREDGVVHLNVLGKQSDSTPG